MVYLEYACQVAVVQSSPQLRTTVHMQLQSKAYSGNILTLAFPATLGPAQAHSPKPLAAIAATIAIIATYSRRHPSYNNQQMLCSIPLVEQGPVRRLLALPKALGEGLL